MSGQYFENNEQLKSEIKEIAYYYCGKKIRLFSDNGVFSKDKIDFGTNLLLKNLELKGDEKVLDIGCGYGVMGISVATVYSNTNVLMADVNARAISLVERAILENKLQNAKVLLSDRYEKIDAQFSTILANPPIRAGKNIVHDIVLGGYDHLISGGSIYVVIQKKQGEPSLYKAMEEVYDLVQIIDKDKGYYIIKGLKK